MDPRRIMGESGSIEDNMDASHRNRPSGFCDVCDELCARPQEWPRAPERMLLDDVIAVNKEDGA